MLTLTRKPGQIIFITDEKTGAKIKITLRSISGNIARLDFEADRQYLIDRDAARSVEPTAAEG